MTQRQLKEAAVGKRDAVEDCNYQMDYLICCYWAFAEGFRSETPLNRMPSSSGWDRERKYSIK